VKDDNDSLRGLLERERVEKGELVRLAEEMMAMQAEQSFIARETHAEAVSSSVGVATTPSARTRKNSLGRASGIKMPGAASAATTGAGESRIGRVHHERTRGTGPAASAGLPRPGSGLAPRSGIMSSIEKMGSYGRRGE
jgi:hypothetical protein